MPRPPRPPRVRTGRHPRRPVRWLSVIAFLEAHIDTIYLDNPVVVDHVRCLGSAEARRILEARLEAARASTVEPTSDSNRDSNPGGRGRSAADAGRSI